MQQRDAAELAAGRWRDLLPALGVERRFLSAKHGPCPKCGGRDRFRFDDREGRGTWFCNVCGAGDGFQLVDLVTGRGFAETAARVRGLAGEIRAKPRPKRDDAENRKALRALWRLSRPIEPGDIADRYLRARGLSGPWPDSLRVAERVDHRESGQMLPALVAVVSATGGKPATLHRTYLRPDGSGKADVTPCRKMMPGTTPKGGAIRLGPVAEHMGVAEGIETALSAAAMFAVPVWSAVNSTLLAQWEPPRDCRRVTIFGDADPKFGGQAAAYTLAHRLACNGLAVSIEIPPAGDWNDMLMERKAA